METNVTDPINFNDVIYYYKESKINVCMLYVFNFFFFFVYFSMNTNIKCNYLMAIKKVQLYYRLMWRTKK